ncbi:MAG: flagellar motor switch protein FliM [Thermodesulfobacteriota bacterium]
MGSILSQEEVDSLLGGMDEEKVQTVTPVPEPEEGLEVYDFGAEAGPVHLKMPILEIINEKFIVFLRKSLFAATGLSLGVSISSVDSIKFGDFYRSIPVPTSLNIFKMEPLRGFSLLVLEAPLVFAFVDTFFGGKAMGHVKLEGKDFTAIEKKIIGKIVNMILGDLQDAWSDFYKLNMIFTRSEMDPQFAEITAHEDIVIVTKLMIDLQNVSGTMTICIPYSLLESVRDKLKQRSHGERLEVDHQWTQYIKERVKQLTINLSCALGNAEITGRELLAMKIGDVIELDQKISDPVIISVEGVPKFIGFPELSNKQRAVKIQGRVNKE